MGDERTLTAPMIGGAAVGVVVLCALLFALVGALRGGYDPATPVIAGGQSPTADATEQVSGSGDPTEPGSAAEGSASPSGDDGAATTAPADDEGGGDQGTATEQASTTEQDTASDDATSEVDPAEVSIQVLDAVGVDGGAAAQATADELRSAGYDVVVINGASRTYDVTTVFWSEGQGPGGRAVASTLGTGEARLTPDEVRLSDTVDVHVVVGLDRS